MMASQAPGANPLREQWDLLPYHVGPSELHFGMSDALVRLTRRPTVWTHSPGRETLILGAGQRLDTVDVDAAKKAGIAVVRRQAGGTSVLATPGVLGTDVAIPTGHPLAIDDVTESYRWFGDVWAGTLQRFGLQPHVVSIEEARSGSSAATVTSDTESILRLICFGGLSPYEVTVNARKLVGLAQVRRRNAVLWQSGVHLHFPAERLASLVSGADARSITAGLRLRAVGLDEATPAHVSLGDLQAAFLAELTDRLHIDLVPRDWTPEELSQAEEVARGLVVEPGVPTSH